MNAQQPKKKRNRKKIKNDEIKILIESKYKDAIKEFCTNNKITMTSFVTEAILFSLKNYGYLEEEE